MTAQDKPWDDKILDAMEAGSVTFAWDDSEIRTIPAPDKTLDTMQSAWEWIDARLKELEKDRGRPRSVCFKLTNGKFRGLKFPDWNPGPM